jgi:hypothetical protein
VNAGRQWPAGFSDATRGLIIIRETPPGTGRPWCVVCGEPITAAVVHIHHRRYLSRGGDGRPSNGIAVHGEGQGPGCHRTRIHDDGATAGANGWAISRHAPAAAYQMPLLCARRGWIVLGDGGGWHKATPAEMAGDYGGGR